MTYLSYALSAAGALALSTSMVFAQQSDITIGQQLEPPHLDPTSAAAGAMVAVVYSHIFEGITRFGSDGSVGPGLATSWDVSEDGKTYTFRLAEGVKFHDGTMMDAEDVVFSLDRARAEDSVNAQKALFAGIESVEATDPATVTVTLKNPDGNFLFNMAWGDAVIVAPESIEGIKTTPIGTGAFMFDNWVQGDRIELKKNPEYWGEPALLEEVTFKFIETILAMNNKMPPLDNVKVREAIAHAINRQEIIDGAQFGYGTPIGTHFAPHPPYYVDLTGLSDYDPEKSKMLLEEAGITLPLKLKMTLPPPSYARRGGEIVAAQLRQVGIEPEIESVEWAQWLEATFRGYDYGLTIISHTEPLDINIYARPEYYFQYDNAEFQALIEKINVESDQAARSEMFKEAQTIIANDYVNAYMFQLPLITVAKTGVEGLWLNAPTQAADMTAVHWAE